MLLSSRKADLSIRTSTILCESLEIFKFCLGREFHYGMCYKFDSFVIETRLGLIENSGLVVYDPLNFIMLF